MGKSLKIIIFKDYCVIKGDMIINNYPNVISQINGVLSTSKFSCLKESRKKFILTTLLCFLSIKDRIIFLQLARFSGFCEQFFRIVSSISKCNTK